MGELTAGDRVIGVSAVLLLIFSFLPWFEATVSYEGGGSDFLPDISESATGNGWDVGFLWSGVPVLFGVAMLAYVLVSRFSPQTDLPDVAWGKILLGLGIAAAALVILKLLIGVSEESLVPNASGIDSQFLEDFSFDVSRQIGVFLAALAAIGLAVGGFLSMRDDTGSGATHPPQAF